MTSNDDRSIGAWDEEDTREFLDYGKYFVPDRELQMQIICDLIPACAGEAHIVDLCCGEGLLSLELLKRYPNVTVHGLDASPKMVEEAQRQLQGFGPRFDAHTFDLADSKWRKFRWPLVAVVSSLAIHHLDVEQKQSLFADVYGMLSSKGGFIIADLVLPSNQLATRLAAKLWDESVRDRALALDGNLDAYQKFQHLEWNLFADPDGDPMDKPSPLLDQLIWLQRAKFTAIDIFWMKAGHAIYGAYKP